MHVNPRCQDSRHLVPCTCMAKVHFSTLRLLLHILVPELSYFAFSRYNFDFLANLSTFVCLLKFSQAKNKSILIPQIVSTLDRINLAYTPIPFADN